MAEQPPTLTHALTDDAESCGKDIKILFQRLWQLETRQVASRKDVEAKIHSFEKRIDEEIATLRGRNLALEAKDEVQDALLEDLNPARLVAEKRLGLLEGRCDDLEVVSKGQRDQSSTMKATLQPLTKLAAQIEELRAETESRVCACEQSMTENQELVDVCLARVKEANQKTESVKMTVNSLARATLHHGVVPDCPCLSDRLALLEAQLRDFTGTYEHFRDETEGSLVQLKEGVQWLNSATETFSTKMETTLEGMERRVYKSELQLDGMRNSLATLQEDMDLDLFHPETDEIAPLPVDDKDDVDEKVENRQHSKAFYKSGSFTSELQGSGSASPSVGGMSAAPSRARMMMVQQAQNWDQLKELIEWRCQVTEDLRKLSRVGRIMEDRLEAFDLVERRTEEVAEKVQALDSDMENARSRSASPPRVAMRLRPEENPDLTLAGKGHAASRVEKPPSRIASPNFEGTGWARALPRRPYSAGSSRGADTPQLQQLREQLANLAGLPLALQKKLQASPGQSVFPSRPPSAGDAIALCRPQRPSSGLRARPLSAK